MNTPSDSRDELRRQYVAYLDKVQAKLTSPYRHQAAESRRMLAQLRHSLLDGRTYQAYEIVFRHHTPDSETEQGVWLLIGGLFGVHPQPWRTNGPRSIGASMGRLARSGGISADRRFAQLLGLDRQALPHHLRQAITLLSAHHIPVDYGQLLADLTTLMGRDYRGDQAGRIRLRWAREYYMPTNAEQHDSPDAATTASEETTQ